MKTILRIFTLLFGVVSFAQTTVTGTVNDQNGMPLPGANIIVIGTSTGAISDFDGKFTLSVSQAPPFEVQISSVGFTTVNEKVTANNQVLSIVMEEGSYLDEVIVSASRTPERIFESPVTVERIGIREIRNTASSDFYDGLENLKGVDINVNSLTFKSVNTRGFATFANNRFLQLVDGMDNSTPALNFPIGNLVGLNESDVQNVELLVGANSAMYGAGAFNGVLFLNSKNPFDYEGVNVDLKAGVTSQEAAGSNGYQELGIRMAKKFNNKFAAKVNFGWLEGTDWYANNLTSKTDGLTRDATNYDGINVYGDETFQNLNQVGLALEAAGVIPAGASASLPSVNITRTGYNEQDLTNYNAKSVKADWGLYFRPFEDDFEISYVGKVGSGTTLYQGANRYNIKNFWQEQHKLEVKNDNFFARIYNVKDDAGDSYDMYMTGVLMNEAWKGSAPDIAAGELGWFGEYATAFLQTQDHAAARAVADTGRLVPGSPAFQQTFDAIVGNPNFGQGSKFQDESSYTHFDANYNFGHLVDFAEIQVGLMKRWWNLNSSGTIYTDTDGPIEYQDTGIYTQIQKTLLDDRLKLTGSIRYDESDNFDGNVSPRLSAGYTAGANRNHNIRVSYQTGFRSPTTQDLFIGLNVGSAQLVGGAPGNAAGFVTQYPLSPGGAFITGSTETDGAGNPAISLNADMAYNNSFFLSSAGAFIASVGAGAPDISLLQVANSNYVKPEQIESYEVGYRGKLDNLIVDLSVYHNTYQDFISTETVLSPLYGSVALNDGTVPVPGFGDVPVAVAALAGGDFAVFRTYTNSDKEVKSYGGSISLSTKILDDFDLNTNYTYAKLDFDRAANPDLATNFNTPEHKVKIGFGKQDLFKNLSFNTAWRWSDNYFWEASFGDGAIPAYHTLDAQVTLALPQIDASIKAGATNMLGDEYFTAFGTGFIGSQYYITLNFGGL